MRVEGIISTGEAAEKAAAVTAMADSLIVSDFITILMTHTVIVY